MVFLNPLKLAFDMGKNGEKLVIPAKYQSAEIVTNHFYQLGLQEKKKNNWIVFVFWTGIVLAWLVRRLYVAWKMIR